MLAEVSVLRFNDRQDERAPDVVFLHGRGATERDAGLVVPAFPGANVRGYRGPLREFGGFSWFANRLIGDATPASLCVEVPKVAAWISADRGASAPWLCGFSNGAAMAAALALESPSSFAGLIMIGGCFPTNALPPGRFEGLPVLFCQGRYDDIIPSEKFRAARAYLKGASAAKATLVSYEGAHELPPELMPTIAQWFGCHQTIYERRTKTG